MASTTGPRKRLRPRSAIESIDVSATAPSEKKELPKKRTWRTYVRWTARVLLVIVGLLSTARVVRISPESQSGSETVLLVITHSRADYLDRCLTSVFHAHPKSNVWDVVISRDRPDGVHADVDAVTNKYVSAARGLRAYSIAHEPKTDPGATVVTDADEDDFVNHTAYRRISAHYRYALDTAFERGAERVVVIEDDMSVSADFFNYFDTLAPILEQDDTLWCVSAWNDNGKPKLAINPEQLYRTDFFPGLGWMLTRELWEELRPQWPEIFWDDWMRNPNISRGRQCIRPEVARVSNFGERGVSMSFHFENHIAKVRPGSERVDFSKLDLSYLEPESFDKLVFQRMSNATKLLFSNYLTSRPQEGDVIAMFPRENPHLIGKRTGIMTDHRFGIFRTSYKGVIIIPWNGYWAFIVPMDYQPPAGYQLGARECC